MDQRLRRNLDRALNPAVVAVIGDKRQSGYMWLRSMQTFSGHVYSVQVNPDEAAGIAELGVRNFASVREIPEPVDYAVCAVPRHVAPRVLVDCIASGVAGIGMFTSGFAETGEELGIRLQDEVVLLARDAGIALIGPNCMGLYNPRLGVRFSQDQPAGAGGRVALVSQSGTHALNVSLMAAANGILLSKAVSVGNAVVLDLPDYLDYFLDDPETDVIAIYVEGPRDGRRFAEALRRAAARKPVVVWKGGLTPAGQRATMSHTASLAASPELFRGLLRQANAISVNSVDELLDVLQLLVRCKPGTGARLGLMAMTGGQSVVITDAFERAGLEVPTLTDRSYTELSEFFNIVGGSYRNPLDMGGTIRDSSENLDRLLHILDADTHVDGIVMEISALFQARRWVREPAALDALVTQLKAHQQQSAKPFLAVLHPSFAEAEVVTARPRVQAAGIAALPSFDRAALALRRVTDRARRAAGMLPLDSATP